MTRPRPRFPGPALLAWLTVTGHAIAAGAPLEWIFVADGGGAAVILAHYLGRLREWERFVPLVSELERGHQGDVRIAPAQERGRRRAA